MSSTPDDPDDGQPAPESPEPSDPGDEPPEAPPPYVPPPAAQPAAPSPYGPPPDGYPGAPPPPTGDLAGQPAPARQGPGIGVGVGTGCGLQILGFLLIFTGLFAMGGMFGWIWPFIVIPVIAGILMIFKRWRRFATGILIVSAATWIIIIGPCLYMISGFG